MDEHPELAAQFAITRVPTLVLFDHAAPIARFSRLMAPQELSAHLRGVLADYADHRRRGSVRSRRRSHAAVPPAAGGDEVQR